MLAVARSSSKSPSRIVCSTSELSDQQDCGGGVEEGFCGGNGGLDVLGQASVTVDTGEDSFHDPAPRPRMDGEAHLPLRSLQTQRVTIRPDCLPLTQSCRIRLETASHTHPGGTEPLPSIGDINVLNRLWAINPNEPAPNSSIIWGPKPENVTAYNAIGFEPIPIPRK